MSSPQQTSSSLSLFLGVFGALASFGVVTWVIQEFSRENPSAELDTARQEKKMEIAKAQDELMAKYGLSGNADAVFLKASEQIKARKLGATPVIVPGTPTALKQAAAAPAPAKPGTPAAPAKAAAPAAPAAPGAPAPAAPPAANPK